MALSHGTRSAIPVMLFLLVGFAAPLLAVIWFSFMPPRSFSFGGAPTLENYRDDLREHELHLLPVVAWACGRHRRPAGAHLLPVAYGLVRVFGKWATLLTLLFTIPLFVSENIRLYGWVLFLIKNGVLLGSLKSLFGLAARKHAVHRAGHHARHGLCLPALHAVSR